MWQQRSSRCSAWWLTLFWSFGCLSPRRRTANPNNYLILLLCRCSGPTAHGNPLRSLAPSGGIGKLIGVISLRGSIMGLLFSLIGLCIRVGGFLIRLVGGIARTILRRLRWLGPVAQFGSNILVVLKHNSLASTAITLSIINFGILMWQVWPEDTVEKTVEISQPTRNSETPGFDNTPRRVTELENQIRELSREQRFQFDRLRDCINYPGPFDCQ